MMKFSQMSVSAQDAYYCIFAVTVMLTLFGFAKHSSKYKELEDEDMKNLSRQVNFARNTIHGQPDVKFNKEIAKFGATMAVLGMYLYILDECSAEDSIKFNFIQCAFA